MTSPGQGMMSAPPVIADIFTASFLTFTPHTLATVYTLEDDHQLTHPSLYPCCNQKNGQQHLQPGDARLHQVAAERGVNWVFWGGLRATSFLTAKAQTPGYSGGHNPEGWVYHHLRSQGSQLGIYPSVWISCFRD